MVTPAQLSFRRQYGWHPPADLLASAQANTWRGDPQPTDPAQRPIGAGVRRLERYVRTKFPLVWHVYDRGPSPDEPHDPSMHYAGRAFDAMIRTIGGLPDRRGDEVANWLLAHARELGIQYMIWSGTQWSSATGRTSVYPGSDDHVNHIHVDMTVPAALGHLPWPPREGGGGSGVMWVVAASAGAWYLWRKKRKHG